MGIQGGIPAVGCDTMLERYRIPRQCLSCPPRMTAGGRILRNCPGGPWRAGLPLIVDEAHGAHFRYGGNVPCPPLTWARGCCHPGVVHKTMPSLTQTALCTSGTTGRTEGVMRTRSGLTVISIWCRAAVPSYVLMASIENSIYQMERMDMGAIPQGNHEAAGTA